MGMMKGARKNPGGILDFLKGEARDMMAIAPSVAVQLGSMAAIGYASAKASEQIKKKAAADGAMHKYAGVISSGAITLAAFAAMKMVKSEKAKQFTLPVLFGGMAATLVQVPGSSASSVFSYKLSSVADQATELMACVSARLSKIPQLMRQPMPQAASELRLKLVIGVEPKAAPQTAANEDSEFATTTKGKVMAAMARVQLAVSSARRVRRAM